MKLGQIVLFSKNSQTTATFLCDVFDLNIETASDSIRIFNEELSLLIVQRPKLSQIGNNLVLDFFVDSIEELQGVQKKVEFVNYRLESSGESIDVDEQERVPRIIEHEGVSFLFLTDPDNRRWKVTLV